MRNVNDFPDYGKLDEELNRRASQESERIATEKHSSSLSFPEILRLEQEKKRRAADKHYNDAILEGEATPEDFDPQQRIKHEQPSAKDPSPEQPTQPHQPPPEQLKNDVKEESSFEEALRDESPQLDKLPILKFTYKDGPVREGRFLGTVGNGKSWKIYERIKRKGKRSAGWTDSKLSFEHVKILMNGEKP